MKTQRITILGAPVDVLSMSETIQLVDRAIVEKKQLHHCAINVAKIVNMRKNRELRNSVTSADIISADGQPLVWASKCLGTPLPERVAGIDLMQQLVEFAHRKNYKIYLLGAKEEVVRKVVDLYSGQYGPQIIAGYRNGYFSKEEEPLIAKEIALSGANLLFVAITSPKKEIFLNKYKDLLKDVSFIMGVGGSFDVVAGKVSRAPVWMQKFGQEWLYRVIQEPRRMWKRYLLTNTTFLYLILKEILFVLVSKLFKPAPNTHLR
jgi:N-acetylglucosaminyldiphosphoundecaprenol N-acetyl-beta-D-mannosaminyltransferase